MVRRSPFWAYLRDKRCLICDDRLESSHASNIRKHFSRRHHADYLRIMNESVSSREQTTTAFASTSGDATMLDDSDAETALIVATNGRRVRRPRAALCDDVATFEFYEAAGWPPLLRMASSTEYPTIADAVALSSASTSPRVTDPVAGIAALLAQAASSTDSFTSSGSTTVCSKSAPNLLETQI